MFSFEIKTNLIGRFEIMHVGPFGYMLKVVCLSDKIILCTYIAISTDKIWLKSMKKLGS